MKWLTNELFRKVVKIKADTTVRLNGFQICMPFPLINLQNLYKFMLHHQQPLKICLKFPAACTNVIFLLIKIFLPCWYETKGLIILFSKSFLLRGVRLCSGFSRLVLKIPHILQHLPIDPFPSPLNITEF